jgi:hypothetical protein
VFVIRADTVGATRTITERVEGIVMSMLRKALLVGALTLMTIGALFAFPSTTGSSGPAHQNAAERAVIQFRGRGRIVQGVGGVAHLVVIVPSARTCVISVVAPTPRVFGLPRKYICRGIDHLTIHVPGVKAHLSVYRFRLVSAPHVTMYVNVRVSPGRVTTTTPTTAPTTTTTNPTTIPTTTTTTTAPPPPLTTTTTTNDPTTTTTTPGSYSSPINPSYNWAGYEVQTDNGQQVTSATGQWTVPTVTCSTGENSDASLWVGLDGLSPSTTVEQAGTLVGCANGAPLYQAWYEMYGDTSVNNGYSVPLNPTKYPVDAGDVTTATITAPTATQAKWSLVLIDQTQQWTFSILVAQPANTPLQSSAEWVVETPKEAESSSVTFSDFGSVTFTDISATESSSNVSPAAYVGVEMVKTWPGAVMAMPSQLENDGTEFTVTWESR